MDDKVFTVEIPWPEIDNGTEASLAAFVLRLMQGSRGTAH